MCELICLFRIYLICSILKHSFIPSLHKNVTMYYFRHVNDIDLFPAGLAERPEKGALLGPTFSCILGRQFGEVRKGDRFWHENDGPQGFSKSKKHK